jgi:hypothetical protein
MQKPSIRPVSVLYLIREPLVALPLLCGFVLSLTVPADVLDPHPRLNALTAWTVSLFPATRAYVDQSMFPGVAQLYFALMILHSPIHLPFLVRLARRDFELAARTKWKDAALLRLMLLSAVLVLLLPGLAYFALVVNPGMELAWMPMSSQRWALGVFGWFFAGFGALAMMTYAVVGASAMYRHVHRRFVRVR